MSKAIEAGQIWEDLDPRAEGRRVQIVQVGLTHATVRTVKASASAPKSLGREVSVSLKRFGAGARGYRLVAPLRVVVRGPRILLDGNVVVSTTGLSEAHVQAMASALGASL